LKTAGFTAEVAEERRGDHKSGGKSGSSKSDKELDEERRSMRETRIKTYALSFHLPYSIFTIPIISEIYTIHPSLITDH
jgi:hypothetical protein